MNTTSVSYPSTGVRNDIMGGFDTPAMNTTSVSHPSTGGGSNGALIPTSLVLDRRSFSLRGELMHCFISYRVTTEGEAGNGLSGLLAERIRALSMEQELQIPQHGFGIWPKGLKPRVPFRKEEAKVFLDTDCLQVIGLLLPCLSLALTYASQHVRAMRSSNGSAPPLQDGQSWLAGFVEGVVTSMVFVPLLSWTEVPQSLTLNPRL